MKVRIGFVGYGDFCKDFVNLFNKHPDVDEIAVAELNPEIRKEIKATYPDFRVYESYDDMLEKATDLNTIGIFTQRHLHGPMVIKALKAGKHVYSAVPIGCTIEEVQEIVKLVEETKLVYMMGETCYYYPAAIYCREKYKEGAFGKFVYGEAQYYHDIREMTEAFLSNGPQWKRVAGIPPMFYPTHSLSMILPALDSYPVKVSCFGLRDDFPDDIFGEEKNNFKNPFSNETAIFQMSDSSVVRINEFRRVGINKPSTYITCFYGENGSYDCIADQHLFQTAPFTDRDGVEHPMHMEYVSDLLMPEAYLDWKNGKTEKYNSTKYKDLEWVDDQSPVSIPTIEGFAKIHDRRRLPKSFRNVPAYSHFNSHPFLVDDFVRAVVENKLPPNNAWEAAKLMIPGLIAHESALKGGELMDIPHLGDAPAEFERLTFEKKDYYEED